MNARLRQIASAAELKFIIVATVLRIASTTTADWSFLVLALLALRGRVAAIQAIALSWAFLMLNPAILPTADQGSVGRYVVLFAAFLMLLVRGKPHHVAAASRPDLVNTATSTLAAFIFYHSMLFSEMVDVSLLKALSWVMSLAVLMQCWQGLAPEERQRSEDFLYLLLTTILVLSIPMLGMAQGRAVNGTGFQGILGHPQTFGITLAMLGTWTVFKVLAVPKASFAQMTIVPVCCGLIVLSEARTALIAMFAGVAVALLLSRFLFGRRLLDLMPGLRNPRLVAVMVIGLPFVPLIVIALDPIIMEFIGKRTQAGGLIEAYSMSRGLLIETMIKNIENNFFTGIGFGIGSVPEEMVITRDPVFGLPISALVEKGALPIAAFEELGVFGLALVLFWVGALLARCARNGITQFGLMVVYLLTNMTEATLFSPGGFGLIGLVFIGWAITGSQTYPAAAAVKRHGRRAAPMRPVR